MRSPKKKKSGEKELSLWLSNYGDAEAWYVEFINESLSAEILAEVCIDYWRVGAAGRGRGLEAFPGLEDDGVDTLDFQSS